MMRHMFSYHSHDNDDDAQTRISPQLRVPHQFAQLMRLNGIYMGLWWVCCDSVRDHIAEKPRV